jgi:hypothetical protein
MASWADVVSYMSSHYKIAEQEPNMLKLIFETGNLRTQVVFLWKITLNNGREEWVQIESPFGEFGRVNLAAALDKVRNTVCGGLAVVGNLVTFRHSIPLKNVDINEIEWPLQMVVGTADEFEHALTGGDTF